MAGFSSFQDFIADTVTNGQMEEFEFTLTSANAGAGLAGAWQEMVSATPGQLLTPLAPNPETVYNVTGTSNPLGCCLGSDNRVWVTYFTTNQIANFTVGGAETIYTCTGAATPKGCCLGSDGRVWICYPGTNKIAAWSAAGVETLYSCTGTATPQYCCLGSDNRVWVTYSGTHKVAAFTTGGVETLYSCTGLAAPEGICSDSTNLWVAYTGTHKVTKWTTGGVETVYATTGTSGPYGITYGADSNLWVTYSLTHKVAKWTTTGVETVYSCTGTATPYGICSDGTALWVMYYGTSKVAKWTTAGVESYIYAVTGSPTPYTCCLGYDSRIWVPYYATNKIAAFNIAQANTVGKAVALTNTTFGVNLPINGNVSPSKRYLIDMQLTATAATFFPGVAYLCDFLLCYPNLGINTSPTPLDNSITLPRYTDGVGVQAIIATTTLLATTAPTITLTYVGTDNTTQSGRLIAPAATSPVSQLFHSNAVATKQGSPFVPWSGSISGIKSVTSYAITNGTATGAACILLVKPLAMFAFNTANVPAEKDLFMQFPSFIEIEDGACLGLLICPGGALAAGSILYGRMRYGWG